MFKLEPILSLAHSVYNCKGSYILLLGSGISKSAGIPTGWEITLDLICQLAKVKDNVDCRADPVAWFKEKYNVSPDYSNLILTIAPGLIDRQKLLENYFEPNEADQSNGKKIPTSAHKAIAELVKKGYIKIIITTNFDRLLEQALFQAGINPVVINHADGIDGARPIADHSCVIIKVHGDYKDNRILNTPEELDCYDPRMKKLLEQLFDDYGMIISSWSATYDKELCRLINNCTNNRTTFYWGTKGEISEEGRSIIARRKGQIITTNGADELFSQLLDKVIAIEDFNRPHPLSKAVAIEMVKRYLTESRFKINLHDLVFTETERVLATLDAMPIQ